MVVQGVSHSAEAYGDGIWPQFQVTGDGFHIVAVPVTAQENAAIGRILRSQKIVDGPY